MKKIYTTLLAMAVASTAAMADVTIGTTSYETLDAAWAAAQSGDVITVNSNQTLGGRLTANNGAGRDITVKGANTSIVITAKKDNMMFLPGASSNIVLESLILEGCGQGSNKAAVGAETNGCSLTLNNVTIRNYEATNNQSIISNKGGGVTNLNNVTVESSCTVAEGKGVVFNGTSGTNKLNLSGKVNVASINPEKALTFTTKADFTTDSPINIILGADRADGIVVYGCTNPDLFTTNIESKVLEAANGNLVLATPSTDVVNENTGKGYKTLEAAIAAASDNDVLVVNTDQELTDRRGGNLTIKGAEGKDVTITMKKGNSIMFLSLENQSVTLENLTLTATDLRDKALVEGNKGSITLRNVKIVNSNTTNGQGLICQKGGKNSATLENITFVNSNASATGCGNIFFGTAGSTIKGDFVGASIKTEQPFAAENLTNETPITLYWKEGLTPIVTNFTEVTRFTSGMEGMTLAVEDGNIVAKELSGINDVELDANAPVDVYNMQGIAVRKGVAAAEATIGLPAGIYIVAGKKVLVK